MNRRATIARLRAMADVLVAMQATHRGDPPSRQRACFRLALAKAARRRLRRWTAPT